MLKIDLVNDTGVRRDDIEIAKCALSPTQEPITLDVAFKLDLVVRCQRLRSAVLVDLHRMIDHELRGCERIDALRIATELDDRLAHRGQVDDARHAGEVLQYDSGGRECDLMRWRSIRVPGEERLDIASFDVDAVFKAQEILEQNLQGIRQARHFVVWERGKACDLVTP